MKMRDLPLSKKESRYKIFKTLITYLIIIVMILTSIGIFIVRDFGLGYKYYELNNNNLCYIGATTEETLFQKTIDDYIDKLSNEGYFIESYSFDTNYFIEKAIIPKSLKNEEDLKRRIIDSLNMSILTTKLVIENDETVYYFKTQTECDEFVNEMNKYIEQKINTEGSVEDISVISSQEILDNKLNSVREEKAKRDAEAKAEAERLAAQRNKQVTSRGGTVSRKNNNYSGGVPLASYVYISSPYGMRNGSMHTGVDFAAYAGTHIYAWKDGTVTFAGWSGGYGNFIIVDHHDGTVSRYAHCSGFAVSKGQNVSKGQTIGYVGTTRKFYREPFTF